MNIKFDFKKLSDIFALFVDICGININVADKNFTYSGMEHYANNAYCSEIHNAPKGRERCLNSDKCLFDKCRKSGKTDTHICHAGLIDIAIPIIWNGEVLSYIILGQMKINNDFDPVKARIKDLDLDMTKMKRIYDELPVFDYEKTQNITALSVILSKYMVMENIFRYETNNVIAAAISYIDENYKHNITIEDITRDIGTSKSTLYKNFKLQYNCTPGEYLNKIRIDKSVDMLLYTDYNMDKITENIGFSTPSYYSKVFKKAYGVSPLKYRKEKVR